MSRDLNASLAWTWSHPAGRYTSITVGVLIDDEKNLYLSAQDGIRKFSPDGAVLWEHLVRPPTYNFNSASIMDGLLFGSFLDGRVYALNMSTGQLAWMRHFEGGQGGDTGYVEAYKGMVVTSVEKAIEIGGGEKKIVCLNASVGDTLWEVNVDTIVWNFMALFPGDDTFLYMDITGGVHRLHLSNGTALWHARTPYPVSFTDGGMVLGPDGTAYACSDVESGVRGTRGSLRAYRLSDGEMIWGREMDLPCTSWPVATSDAVVVPISPFVDSPLALHLHWMPSFVRDTYHFLSRHLGYKVRWLVPTWLGLPEVPLTRSEIVAYHPKTGRLLWRYVAPLHDRIHALGDEEGMFTRDLTRIICLPAMWASPTMSGDGTTYVGRSDGRLYAVRNANGDEIVEGEDEVSTFWTGGGALHPGPAFAPGLMAVATCDSLFVFRWP